MTHSAVEKISRIDFFFMRPCNAAIPFSILLTILLGAECNSVQHSTSRKAQYKSIYTHQFKLTYFRQILIKSYNNSKAIQEIIALDHSGFTEPILTEDDYKLIDSFATIHNQKMNMDSANSIGRVAEGAEGKHPLGFILDKLESKWLDSLANNRYKVSGVKKSYKD